MPRLAARAARDHERHHPEDERERRHQNRPQTDARGFDGGVDDAHPATAQLLGELHDENAVLRRQADEHDEANLAVHVVDQSAPPLRQERAENGERHRQRMMNGSVTLVCPAGQIDQQQAKGEMSTACLPALISSNRPDHANVMPQQHALESCSMS